MVVQIDHYGVLGLASGAGLSKEEIKKAYRSKLLVVHDDPAEFLKLLHSYKVLKDPESRKLFDDHLRIQREREGKLLRRKASSFVVVKEEDIIDVDRITKTKRRRMMSRSANSFVKDEDIIDVESISKITKEEDDTTKLRRSAASSFVKKDIIDAESISKIAPKQEVSCFVKEEDIINAVSISKIAAKQEENDSKTANSFVKREDISVKQEDEMPANMLVLWHLRKPFCDYTVQTLYEIFGYFGYVRGVSILYNCRSYHEAMAASVQMASKEAATAAVSYRHVLGHHSNPVHAFRLPGPGEDMDESIARYLEFLTSNGFSFVNSSY